MQFTKCVATGLSILTGAIQIVSAHPNANQTVQAISDLRRIFVDARMTVDMPEESFQAAIGELMQSNGQVAEILIGIENGSRRWAIERYQISESMPENQLLAVYARLQEDVQVRTIFLRDRHHILVNSDYAQIRAASTLLRFFRRRLGHRLTEAEFARVDALVGTLNTAFRRRVLSTVPRAARSSPST